jgi:hypothetical protein
MSLVWKHAPVDGTELLMLLAMADYCHDDGTNIFPGVATLAAKVRISERRAQEVLQSLRDKGLIARQDKLLNGPWRYRIILGNLTIRGAENRTPQPEGVRNLAPGGAKSRVSSEGHLLNEPSVEPSTNDEPAVRPMKQRTYTKVFDEWWTAYGKRGSKFEAFRVWEKLSAEDRVLAQSGISNYLASEKPTNGYVVDGSRYLRGRHWETEPVSPNGRHESTEDEKAYWRARVEAARDGKVFDEAAWRNDAARSANPG